MSNSQVAYDLCRDLQQSIGAVLERKLKVMRHALEPAELSIMLIEIAVSMQLTAAATIAAQVVETEAANMFDLTLASIATFAAAARDDSLAKVAAVRAEKAVQA